MSEKRPTKYEFWLQDRISALEAEIQERQAVTLKYKKGYVALRKAALKVLQNWETSHLAEAVTELGVLIGFNPPPASRAPRRDTGAGEGNSTEFRV